MDIDDEKLLSPRELRFCVRYANHGNGARAVREAGGYRESNARCMAHDLLKRPHITAKINELRAEIIKDVQPTVQDVLRHLSAVVMADPNELSEVQVTCCRHCWSFGMGYKRTKPEMRQARIDYERAVIEAAKKDEVLPPFDELGGDTFNPTEDPDPDCEHCFGSGVPSVVVKDTRTLSPGARSLYAGAKYGKHGIEVLTRDPVHSLKMIAQHLGMLKDVLLVKNEDLTDAQIDARIAELEGKTPGSEFA